ncbi:MAG: alpha/beta fold hydrolase, partial [Pikeienuella sp.]
VRLHYVDLGEGPSRVLIHGASGTLRDWTFSLTERLGDRFRVIAIDRPGHGYSGRLARDGADPEAQARLFAAAAAALGAGRVLIAGHSWGGALAVAWALNRPDQVAGAAIIAGATQPWGGDGGLLYRLGAGPLSPAVGALARLYAGDGGAEGLIAGIFAPDPVPPGYADHIGVELALRPDTFRWNAEDIDRLNGHLARISPRYGELSTPMEIIHGDADEIVGLDIHSIPLSRTARNARLTVLKGVGHMPHHAREDEVIAALDRLAAAAQ